MHNRHSPLVNGFRFFPVVLLAGLLVLAGCRTYGNEKHETGPKTYEALQQTVNQLEQELGRAESDLRRLESAAEADPDLQLLAERYRSFVESHRAALEGHRTAAERLSAGASYRTLHSAFGAAVTDRRILRKQYQRTVRKVWATVRGVDIPRKPARDRSQYVDTPVNFPQLGERVSLTMAEALRAVDGTPGLQREEQPAGSEE